jgi:hypothetical protein
MSVVNEKKSYSLQEIQNSLSVEQHRLIHFCEKGVIVPDFGDSSGRGSMRRFSERNLFEFALALELRRYQLPLVFIAPIIRILEAFERYAAKDLKIFSLPASLQTKAAIELHIIVAEGTQLIFGIKSGKSNSFLGPFDLNDVVRASTSGLSGVKKFSADPRAKYISYIEINLNMIAQTLK